MRGLVVGLLLALTCASAAAAQGGRAATLIRQARDHLEVLNGDSAAPLLEQALRAAPTTAEQVRIWYLLGIALMNKERPDQSYAQEAFRRALRLSPSLRIDSLAQFGDDVLRQFQDAVRASAAEPVAGPSGAVVAPARLVVEIAVPDTQLSATGEALPITLRPSRRATTIVAVGPADAPLVTSWSDTLPAGATGSLGWNLRTPTGELVPSQRYAVRATATDSAGNVSDTRQLVFVVWRLPVDTQALPAPPPVEPETLRVRLASPAALLAGAALGAAAGILPTALGRPEVNDGLSGDGKAYAIAGAVSAAGVVGFLAGHRERFQPEVHARNVERARAHEQAVRDVAAANARALANAAIRVRVERTP